MPFLPFGPNDDEDDDTQVLRGADPVGIGYAHGATPNRGPQPTQSQAPTAGPTDFVNFDRIFSANADVATQRAGELATGVEKQATEANMAGVSAADQYQKALAASAKPAYQGQSLYGSTGGTKRQELRGDGPQTGEVVSGGPTNVDQARQYASGTFDQPKSLLETQYGKDAQSKIGKAQGAINQLGPDGDLQSLIQNRYGASGGSKMDAALLGSAGRGQFDDLYRGFSRLDKVFGDSVAASGDQYDRAAQDYANATDGWGAAVQAYDARQAEAEKPKMPSEDELKAKYEAWYRTQGFVQMPYDEWKAQGYPGWENL